MPELPEVEVICQGLRPHIVGKTIQAIHWSGKELRTPVNIEGMQQELLHQQITNLTRRAKYLILETEGGARLIMHLGMTGNLGIFAVDSPLKKHDHLRWVLGEHQEMRLNDARRFGSVHLIEAQNGLAKQKAFFANSGPEPFSRACSTAYLHKRAATRKQAVKNVIMDSHIIAGIGNIYANEALFRAGIHPARPASSLSEKEWRRLLTTIRKTLRHAIECGGSTISDFINASGEGGYFQINFQVYGKENEQCSRCKQQIEKTVIGGRASFFCPSCQKIPP